MYKKRLIRSPKASSPKKPLRRSATVRPSRTKKSPSPLSSSKRKTSPIRRKQPLSPSSPSKKKMIQKTPPRYSFSRPPPIPSPSSPLFVSSSSTSSSSSGPKQQLDKRIKSSRIVIFGRTDCGWCRRAKEMFDEMNAPYTFVDIYDPNFTREEMVLLNEMTSPTETVPRIFIGGIFTGGYADTSEKIKDGKIKI